MSEETGNKAIVRRRMRATREELFDAWTDQEGMREWMCPGDVVSADVRLEPRVGGALHITMHSPSAIYEHTGEFRVVERPSKLAFTWTADNMDGQVTLVTVEFLEVSPNGDGSHPDARAHSKSRRARSLSKRLDEDRQRPGTIPGGPPCLTFAITSKSRLPPKPSILWSLPALDSRRGGPPM